MLQVFGKLLSSEEGETPSGGPAQAAGPVTAEPDTEEDTDLRQHMVSILFSRCKLTHLQTQVRGETRQTGSGQSRDTPDRLRSEGRLGRQAGHVRHEQTQVREDTRQTGSGQRRDSSDRLRSEAGRLLSE